MFSKLHHEIFRQVLAAELARVPFELPTLPEQGEPVSDELKAEVAALHDRFQRIAKYSGMFAMITLAEHEYNLKRFFEEFDVRPTPSEEDEDNSGDTSLN